MRPSECCASYLATYCEGPINYSDICSNVNFKYPTRWLQATVVEVGAVEGSHERLHLGRV